MIKACMFVPPHGIYGSVVFRLFFADSWGSIFKRFGSLTVNFREVRALSSARRRRGLFRRRR